MTENHPMSLAVSVIGSVVTTRAAGGHLDRARVFADARTEAYLRRRGRDSGEQASELPDGDLPGRERRG